MTDPATDNLGRKLPAYEEVADVRDGKVVAMFYWTRQDLRPGRPRRFY